MMVPNINCTKCKKGRCTYWRRVKECLLIAGKYCGAQQHYKIPNPPPAPPIKKVNFQRSFLLEESKEVIGKELQIGKCLKISVELWNEYLKLPVEHPDQVDEFARAIHVIQEKLALKIARKYRPDLFPNKMNEEPTDEST